MSSVKKATLCAVCLALCCVLPTAFHAVGLGGAFSPLHLPALLCGLICGWPYGLFCGLAGPALSCLITGMPSAVQLSWMLPELGAYGLTAGLLYRWIRTGSLTADLVLSLAAAMLLGRIAGGAAKALFLLPTDRPMTLPLWISGYFVQTLPGAVLQLILLPALVLALTKAGILPQRYEKRKKHESDR